MNRDTIVLAGGGTGGHVFPMIAIAEELRELAPDVELVFVGTERGLERQVVAERGWPLHLLRVEPIRGRGPLGMLRGVARAAASLPEAINLCRRLQPKVVFSIGGYAAGAMALAARWQGIPLALMEPNSVLGLTNHAVAPFVVRAYTAFPEVERWFPAGTVLRSGVALRRGFEPREYVAPQGVLRVLVLGGSQGAQALNETVPEALQLAKTPCRVVHQAGKGKDTAVRSRYRALGASDVDVMPFIVDMPGALAEADLVIGRSGASAVAEICAVGRPSILVPYPHASGDHQYQNALSLVRAGAAVCIRSQEASARRLAEEIDRLANNPTELAQMARIAATLGRPDAAEAVASDLIDLGHVPSAGAGEDLNLNGSGRSPSAPWEVH